MLYRVEGVFVGLVGRPLLMLLSWLRWPLLAVGCYFNLYLYGSSLESARATVIPSLVGILLWSVGAAVGRYDDAYRDYMALSERLEAHPLAARMPMDNRWAGLDGMGEGGGEED